MHRYQLIYPFLFDRHDLASNRPPITGVNYIVPVESDGEGHELSPENILLVPLFSIYKVAVRCHPAALADMQAIWPDATVLSAEEYAQIMLFTIEQAERPQPRPSRFENFSLN